MSRTCISCDSCIAIKETAPFGVCIFFPSGHRNVNVLKDTCPNHSLEREEDREADENYYKSLKKRK